MSHKREAYTTWLASAGVDEGMSVLREMEEDEKSLTVFNSLWEKYKYRRWVSPLQISDYSFEQHQPKHEGYPEDVLSYERTWD